jgi:hypothetical protein
MNGQFGFLNGLVLQAKQPSSFFAENYAFRRVGLFMLLVREERRYGPNPVTDNDDFDFEDSQLVLV